MTHQDLITIPTIEDLTRREFISSALAAALLIACGDDDEDSTPPSNGSARFPVTVEHLFGTTTIGSEPQRVVVAGLHEPDFLYALGVAPVGVHEWWGGFDYATGPWAQELRAQLGATPTVMPEWEIDVEWVAAQAPDLIVVTYHDIDQQLYDRLSAIAPVVAHPRGFEVWTAPWQVELRLLGDALGRRERAEEVIATVDKLAADIAARHPEFAGKHINTVNFYPETGFESYSSEEALNQVLRGFGFVVPASYDELADGIYVEFSLERMSLLDDLDVALWFSENQGTLEAIELYRTTRLFQEGRSIWLKGDLTAALSFNTPLSIQYYLAELEPLLVAALDGDPSTIIPEIR